MKAAVVKGNSKVEIEDFDISGIGPNELLIWPETAFDDYYNDHRVRSLIGVKIRDELSKYRIDLITGVFEVNQDRYFNSIYFLGSFLSNFLITNCAVFFKFLTLE